MSDTEIRRLVAEVRRHQLEEVLFKELFPSVFVVLARTSDRYGRLTTGDPEPLAVFATEEKSEMTLASLRETPAIKARCVRVPTSVEFGTVVVKMISTGKVTEKKKVGHISLMAAQASRGPVFYGYGRTDEEAQKSAETCRSEWIRNGLQELPDHVFGDIVFSDDFGSSLSFPF